MYCFEKCHKNTNIALKSIRKSFLPHTVYVTRVLYRDIMYLSVHRFNKKPVQIMRHSTGK